MSPHAKTATGIPTNRLTWLPLLVGIGLTLVLTVYPLLLSRGQGGANHGVAMLAFWAMSAGYVRGVGFVPEHRILRHLLSTWACLGALAAAVLMLLVQYGG